MNNIYLYNIRSFNASSYERLKITGDSLSNITRSKRNMSNIISDIESVIKILKSIKDSYNNNPKVYELEYLIRRYETLADTLYKMNSQLLNSLSSSCNYIINNYKSKSAVISNIANDMKDVRI